MTAKSQSSVDFPTSTKRHSPVCVGAAGRLFCRLLCFSLLLCSAKVALGQGTISFRYFYDELGQLTKVVDSTGVVIEYVYDSVGNLLEIERSVLSSPTALAIFNVIPRQGPEGTQVTIQGQGFSATPSQNTVLFNGTAATVSSATATQLVVTVPAGATTGPISVTVGGVTVQGGTFTVLPSLRSITVTPVNPSIAVGFTLQFTATGTFSDGTKQDLTVSVTWTSSDTAVARINNASGSQGLATAIGAGTTTITATSGSISGSTTLRVTLVPVVLSLVVTPTNPSIPVGSVVRFTATGTFNDGTVRDVTTSVTWSSSNAAVATISNQLGSQGVALTVGVGTARISAASGSVTDSTTLTVTPAAGPVPRFAYVVDERWPAVSIYTVNANSGRLRPNGYVLTPTPSPEPIVVTPSGKFAYVADLNPSNESILGYTIDPANGALTPIPGSPFSAPGAESVTVDPSGRFLYTANLAVSAFTTVSLSAFTIDSVTGALTAVPGSPFPRRSGGAAILMAVDPSGKFLYVPNSSSGSISAFTINSTTGALTEVPGSPFAAGSGPQGVAISPSGKFVYVVNGTSNDVSGFTLDPSTGALTAVPGSPFPAVGDPRSVAVDPSGKFVYVANVSDGVSAFTVNAATGALTQVAGSPFQAFGPLSLVVDVSGRFVYAPEFRLNSIGILIIDPTSGALADVDRVQDLFGAVRTKGGPGSIALTSGSTPVSYTPKFAYVANSGDNNLSGYTIDASTGVLAQLTGSPFAVGTSPASVATDLLSRLLYVANSGSNNVSAFTVDSTVGSLNAIAGSPFGAGSGPSSVAVDPSRRFVYVTNKNSNTVSAYTIDLTSGALVAVAGSPFATGRSPSAVAVDPLGNSVAVANLADNTVSFYAIIPQTGALSPATGSPFAAKTAAVSLAFDPLGYFLYVAGVGGVSVFFIDPFSDTPSFLAVGSPFLAGNTPSSVVVEPTGKFIYVTNQGSNDISGFSVNRSGVSTGLLTPVPGSPFPAGSGPSSVTVDPSGQFVYVTNKGDNTVSVYTIDSNTGALTPVAGSPFPTGASPVAITVVGKVQ